MEDEEDKFEKKNKEVENRSIISGGGCYSDGNDKDMEELDKVVEFGKLVSLQPTRFLDVVTWFFVFTDIFLI